MPFDLKKDVSFNVNVVLAEVMKIEIWFHEICISLRSPFYLCFTQCPNARVIRIVVSK